MQQTSEWRWSSAWDRRSLREWEVCSCRESKGTQCSRKWQRGSECRRTRPGGGRKWIWNWIGYSVESAWWGCDRAVDGLTVNWPDSWGDRVSQLWQRRWMLVASVLEEWWGIQIGPESHPPGAFATHGWSCSTGKEDKRTHDERTELSLYGKGIVRKRKPFHNRCQLLQCLNATLGSGCLTDELLYAVPDLLLTPFCFLYIKGESIHEKTISAFLPFSVLFFPLLAWEVRYDYLMLDDPQGMLSKCIRREFHCWATVIPGGHHISSNITHRLGITAPVRVGQTGRGYQVNVRVSRLFGWCRIAEYCIWAWFECVVNDEQFWRLACCSRLTGM